MDRITGSLGATVTWFNPKTNKLLMTMNYDLICKSRYSEIALGCFNPRAVSILAPTSLTTLAPSNPGTRPPEAIVGGVPNAGEPMIPRRSPGWIGAIGPTLVASVAAAYAPTRAIRFRPHAHFIRSISSDPVDALVRRVFDFPGGSPLLDLGTLDE